MPGKRLSREADGEADAECRAHYGAALDPFVYVPAHIADRLVGPPKSPPSLDRHRKECLILAKEIGKLQTGKAVDHHWAASCLAILGLNALGVEAWDFVTEDNEAALIAVVEAAKAQVKHDSVAKSCRELDAQGSPF